MFFILTIILSLLSNTLSFHHTVFKRSVKSENNFEVKGADYVYACMRENKCVHVKEFEIQENVTSSCNEQNLYVSFYNINELNVSQKLNGYLTQELGAAMMGRQHTTAECKFIKK